MLPRPRLLGYRELTGGELAHMRIVPKAVWEAALVQPQLRRARELEGAILEHR